MQTFLPYPEFHRSMQVLDYRRLGKQRVEAKQILSTLLGLSVGWANHPAVRMWAGYEHALAEYGFAACFEWRAVRGFRDSCQPWFVNWMSHLRDDTGMPPWLGDAAFHASHRSNLLRKDAAHYGRFGWQEPPTLPYVWPAWPPAR